MARIEPFKGIRPRKDLVYQLASPPYDVINSEEAKVLCEGNPVSFLHVSKPEVDLPDNIDHYADEVYAKARENFNRFLQEKIMVQDTTKNFYIYKQIWGDHVQIGLVAAASCQDYQDDIIKKHELTREDKETDRTRHLEAINANSGPVFLTYKYKDSIDVLIKKAMEMEPEYDFVKDDVRNIVYVVRDQNLIDAIKAEFAKIDYLYVADGHHRSASATNVKVKRQKENINHTGNEEYNFFLSVIFPHNQMKILPYNRVVKDLNGFSKQDFFNKISEKFDCKETDLKVPTKNTEFCMYIDGKWFLLSAKEGTFKKDDAIDALDVSILQNNLLNPILGIKDPRKEKRIDFVGGIRGTAELEKLVNNGGFVVAFSLYPTTIEQLFDVADTGNIMPPKSTWFEPKLKSGVVVHSLED